MAFGYCQSLERITIPEGVAHLADIFGNTWALTEINLPNSLRTIGDRAFLGMRALTSLKLPDAVEQLGAELFAHSTGLSSITIPAGVTSIGDHVFDNSYLNDIYIHGNVSSIGASAIKSRPTVHGMPGSAAQTWAEENGYPFAAHTDAHEPVTDPAVEPTCTEAGLTEGSHCPVCGDVLAAQQVVPAKGHAPVTDAAVEPGCANTGLTEGSHCSACGVVFVAQEPVPARGHAPVTDPAAEPTCTEPGRTEGSHCSACGEILVAQEPVPAPGHSGVIDPAVPATHVTTGLTEGSHCAVCGETLVAQEVIPAVEVEKLVLPAGLRAIEAEAFAGDSMVCVVLPQGCAKIGGSAFRDCRQLRFVEIPASVTSIDSTAFDGCGDLIIVTVSGSEAERFARENGVTCVLRG